MKATVFKPGTRRLILAGIAIAVLLLLVGAGAWLVGFSRLDRLETASRDATAAARGSSKDIQGPQDLDPAYQAATAAYQNKDYQTAIDNFGKIVAFQPDYKDSLPLLFLSYRGLGELQSSDLGKLDAAPQTLAQAVGLTRTESDGLKAGFARNPALLPAGLGNYDALAQRVADEQVWATDYAKGATITTQQPGWWDDAITAWEPVYQGNPGYLKEAGDMWVSARLADTYQAKAVYLCRVKADYTQALGAINRAIEIGRNSHLPDTRQRLFVQFLNFVYQGQCQVG
ncbi:MAG: hypothetical protein J0I20_11605 [Chloroflexi bacterium]|nr:hypothetical protein [Chloroflexota bacterium]OJV92381.1 MAG: hypothetical protein BGO39_31125 [Chloroflexi bacterium 54-19]